MDSINSSPPERASSAGFHLCLLGVFGALSLLSRVRHTNEPRHRAPRRAARIRSIWAPLRVRRKGVAGGPGPCPRERRGRRWARAFLQRRERRAAPSPHIHLQPEPACVGEGSIYSVLFLAPSSEEPDSQLMTGTHRGVSAALWNEHSSSRCAEAQGCCICKFPSFPGRWAV